MYSKKYAEKIGKNYATSKVLETTEYTEVSLCLVSLFGRNV
jgi:hypothetical protein